MGLLSSFYADRNDSLSPMREVVAGKSIVHDPQTGGQLYCALPCVGCPIQLTGTCIEGGTKWLHMIAYWPDSVHPSKDTQGAVFAAGLVTFELCDCCSSCSHIHVQAAIKGLQQAHQALEDAKQAAAAAAADAAAKHAERKATLEAAAGAAEAFAQERASTKAADLHLSPRLSALADALFGTPGKGECLPMKLLHAWICFIGRCSCPRHQAGGHCHDR